MRKLFISAIVSVLVLGCTSVRKTAQQNSEKGLKDYYRDYFKMGVAVGPSDLNGKSAEFIIKHYNSLTAENAMKMGPIHPEENRYFWNDADSIVNFALRHGIGVRGHNLCWHEQTPNWIFKDRDGKQVTKEVLLQRLKDHIFTVAGRYKGKIYAWDVVNEVIDDDDSRLLRNSLWYQICGEDFIIKAFEYAHQADPNAKLYYNDYNTERPGKMNRLYLLMKKLVDAKVPIDGVGLQAHWSIYEPSEQELRTTIQKLTSLGLDIQITELDMSIYPWEKEKRAKKTDEADQLTPELEQKQIEQYSLVFNIFREYRKNISNVTFWNLSDKYTWLDTYPVAGRKNYPLLFDANLEPKKAYWKVVDFKK